MRWLPFIIAVILCTAVFGLYMSLNSVPKHTVWSVLKIGAGGFITGIDIAGDGTKVVRADTYGAWYYDNSTSLWRQCVTKQSMPDRFRAVLKNRGVYEIVIAPSNTNRFFMLYDGYVLRSDNRCKTWILTNFTRDTADFGNMVPENGPYRTYGPKMAVDPANQDIAYVGTASQGMFVTADGGYTWKSISPLIAYSSSVRGAYPGYAIAFDPSAPVSRGVTQSIYIASYGTGVYHSTDGGASWRLTKSGPATFQHMIVDKNGSVWLCDDLDAGQLHKYTRALWSTVRGAGNECHSIAVNPTNANDIYVGTNSGMLVLSTNGGDSWVGPDPGSISATDIPWLAWAHDTWLSNGDMKFDPSRYNRLYFASGTGVFYTNAPTTKATVTWISQNAAIEQLVSNWIISPPEGTPIVASWDRPVFTISDPESYQSRYGINNANEIQHGSSCDWASSSPKTIVCIADTSRADSSGYSKDGGFTWRTFLTLPSEIGNAYYGGSIAASTNNNFVWVSSNCGDPFFTENGGVSWTRVAIAGIPANDCGWHRAFYLDRQIVIADRVSRNTFYMYNDGSMTSSAAGVWKSSNGGKSWSHVVSNALDRGGASNFNAQMRSVPGVAGNFYFSSGWQSGAQPIDQPFWECNDDGKETKCKTIVDVKEVFSFGFGKPAPRKHYPTVFIYGWVKDVLGIWRSDDHCATWTRISDGFPTESLDRVKVIEGDNNTYGTVYVGFAGSGYAYGILR